MSGTTLTEYCGPHCGTRDGLTAHCRCCHEFSYGEADGCAFGSHADGSRWFAISETHEPGSHALEGLYDRERAATEGLTFGGPITRPRYPDY